MSAVAVTGIIEKTLSIADKLLDKIPNYDQRKRDQYHKLKKIYRDERDKENQDMDLMLDLLDMVNDIFDTYHREIMGGA